MKKIILAFSILATSFVAGAQANSGKTSFGGGVRIGLPVGDASDYSSFLVGAELQAEHKFSTQVAGTFTTGYNRFLGKDYTIPGFGTFEGEGFGFIPVLAGVRVYPSSQFFIGGKAGISFSTQSGGGSAFTYEPQVGFNGQKFQLALGYQAQTDDGATTSHLGLTGIIKFN